MTARIAGQLNRWMLIACRLALVATFFAAVVYACGCAVMQKAIRTVDQISEDACVLFGTQHPDEFRALVIQAKPELADKARAAPNLNIVKTLCALREIVSPFLQQQQALQRQSAASLQRPPDLGSGSGSEQPGARP